MVTFNQVRFIDQAVRSVLAQQAKFPIELVIGDDCSTDGTTDRLQVLAAEHPTKIRLLTHQSNVGFARNSLDVMAHCRGEYLACLDGDDYWTTTDGLARQVAYLQSHPECALCFGRADYLIDATGEIYAGAVGPAQRQASYDLDDLLAQGNFVTTNSVVLRRSLLDQEALARHGLALLCIDFIKHLLLATQGRLGYIDEVFYVYRGHSGGVFNGQSKVKQVRAALAVYEEMGAALQVNERTSFRLGVARGNLDLFRALGRSDGLRSRFEAAARALRFAPMRRKPGVGWAILRETAGKLGRRWGGTAEAAGSEQGGGGT
jgi:glycosyltransferase involved in cell wall biosynthesis